MKKKSRRQKNKRLTLFALLLTGTALLIWLFSPKNPVINQLTTSLKGNLDNSNSFDLAALFDGQSGYIQINYPNNPQLKLGATIETWFQPTQMPPFDQGVIVAQEGGFDINVFADLNPNDNTKARFYYTFSVPNEGNRCYNTGLTSEYIIPKTSALDWQHLAAVIQDDGTLSFFINGRQYPTNLPQVKITNICQKSSPINIGAWHNSLKAWGFLPGQLEELRISNIARYSESFTPPYQQFPIDQKTLAIYHFNGNVYDLSGNNYLGQIIGNVSFVPSTIGPGPSSSPNPSPSPNLEACSATCFKIGKRPICLQLPCRVK